jgi:hypothetical protein
MSHMNIQVTRFSSGVVKMSLLRIREWPVIWVRRSCLRDEYRVYRDETHSSISNKTPDGERDPAIRRRPLCGLSK